MGMGFRGREAAGFRVPRRLATPRPRCLVFNM